MRFYWYQDLLSQKHLYVYWNLGTFNLGDYYSKHHAAKHHSTLRPIYMHKKISPREIPTNSSSGLLECIDLYKDTQKQNANPITIILCQTIKDHCNMGSL